MTTPTRRISFYLKPAAVKSEQEACNYLDSLPASERSRAQRAAFLAGLALIKRHPALAYSLAEWSDNEIRIPSLPAQPEKLTAKSNSNTQAIKDNIRALFPE
ncbi:TPA: peptide transporter [Escherichia coli]|nr:peptide transporter [Escherichia coli]